MVLALRKQPGSRPQNSSVSQSACFTVCRLKIADFGLHCKLCRHIVEFKGVGCTEPHSPESMAASLYIVQEYMSGSTLKVSIYTKSVRHITCNIQICLMSLYRVYGQLYRCNAEIVSKLLALSTEDSL